MMEILKIMSSENEDQSLKGRPGNKPQGANAMKTTTTKPEPQDVTRIRSLVTGVPLKFALWLIFVLVFTCKQLSADSPWPIWKDGKAICHLVLPTGDEHAARLAQSTLAHYLQEFYNIEMPVAANTEEKGTYLLLGTPGNNPALAKLVKGGLQLTARDLGNEGFQLLTHQDRKSKYLIAYAKTPSALKYACQELIFYRWRATALGGRLDTSLNIVMKPQVEYRGSYILPCWSAQDSFESWERVLRFNSEITLNRNWFWLDGFPIAGHSGEYTNTALSDASNVQRLFDLTTAEDMKIYIGGGWFNWHHEKAVGKNYAKGISYYLDYLKAFTNFNGFYIEPTGEGQEIKDWRPEAEAFLTLVHEVLKQRPDFEVAVAIGEFNNPEYLKLMREMDPGRVYWWWCWGDPISNHVLELYPSVLRWHITMSMEYYHGSLEPPDLSEGKLAGVVTSYDPGQGFGNPWNGWGKLGVDKPRNVDPYTLPYFGHEYYFRERCWNLELTETEFLARLQCRLFDADAPKDAAKHYWRLSLMAYESNYKRFPYYFRVNYAEQLASERRFLESLRQRDWSPRMKDTIARMEEALKGLTEWAPKKKQ